MSSRSPACPRPPRAPWLAALVVGLASGLAACARPSGPGPAPAAERELDPARYYTIWLGGARVGTATETETWSASGVILRRHERLAFLRGNVPVTISTTIEVEADRELVASAVRWTEQGVTRRHAVAIRTSTGWAISTACGDDGCARGATTRTVPTDAVPAELIPMVVRRDGAFHGTVFLPARGFVTGVGRVAPIAPRRLVARLALDARVRVEATIDLGDDGIPTRVVDGDGVIAMRASRLEAEAAFEPVDLIEATSVPLIGTRSDQIALIGELDVPDLPGQARAPGHPGELVLALSDELPGGLPPGPRGVDRSAQITTLVAYVQHRIAPDLSAAAGSPHDADVATAGDCTTFALAYAALAERSAIPTRVVTGLRIDGARLVRHRWAVSWTGRAWIAVDAAFGAAPAGGELIGLAIHGGDDAGLISGEAALTRVRAASWL